MPTNTLRVAFIHPDLGIGGAERLVVDAALGLQALGHSVDIYTSHHDRDHCFEETTNGAYLACSSRTLSELTPRSKGSLTVHHIPPPFPRSLKGKFHILFAHLRQLHLTTHLLLPSAPQYNVYFVDQLSTCIPFLRAFASTRVVFYCHFPDKLLANGEFVDGDVVPAKVGLLKSIYRYPMDRLEEFTTGAPFPLSRHYFTSLLTCYGFAAQADVILANSRFTARVFKTYFTIAKLPIPTVVYPGINTAAYEFTPADSTDPDVRQVLS